MSAQLRSLLQIERQRGQDMTPRMNEVLRLRLSTIARAGLDEDTMNREVETALRQFKAFTGRDAPDFPIIAL
jgi:hypothetical protein